MASPREPAIVQVFLLVRPHLASENEFAMRKAPEAANDVTMSFGVGEIRLPKAPDERHGALLAGQISEWAKGR